MMLKYDFSSRRVENMLVPGNGEFLWAPWSYVLTEKAGDVSMAVKTAKMRKRARKLCLVCRRPIPQARLKVLPDTTTCVKCASVERYSSLDLPVDVFAQHTIDSQQYEEES